MDLNSPFLPFPKVPQHWLQSQLQPVKFLPVVLKCQSVLLLFSVSSNTSSPCLSQGIFHSSRLNSQERTHTNFWLYYTCTNLFSFLSIFWCTLFIYLILKGNCYIGNSGCLLFKKFTFSETQTWKVNYLINYYCFLSLYHRSLIKTNTINNIPASLIMSLCYKSLTPTTEVINILTQIIIAYYRITNKENYIMK